MLTDIETELIDNFFVSHNIKHFTRSTFVLAVANTFPNWRGEQLCNCYDYVSCEQTTPEVFYEYVNKLLQDAKE